MDKGEDNLLSLPTLAPVDVSADTVPGQAAAIAPEANKLALLPTLDAADGAAADRNAETILPHDLETLPPIPPSADGADALHDRVPPGSATGSASGADNTSVAAQRANRAATVPASEVLEPGAVVHGQYELIRELGRGGMGVVYLARDIRLGRKVAVKFVLLGSKSTKKRFLTEARTTARCTHPSIVVVHEADEFHGMPYMVLEYLEGRTLRQVMDASTADDGARGLSAARTLELMLPVLHALEHAHGMGIVHRDLKPENIIVTDTGMVKVLDFGIAKVTGERAGDERLDGHRALDGLDLVPAMTQAGALVGTLPYMSPEQLNGESSDHQVDIWAAAVMLFEMIASHHPMAPLSMRVYQRIADINLAMPGTRELCPDIGPLGPIIDRCLLKKKADRTRTIGEFIAELEPYLPRRQNLSSTSEGVSPFTGLSAFQEGDADRFFGRTEDTLAVVSRVREQPLVAVIGPSGAGKSSLVRAGVIPTLKRSGEGWQAYIIRPGRAPLAALAEVVARLDRGSTSRVDRKDAMGGDDDGLSLSRDSVVERIRAEPGYLGVQLRDRAARKLRRTVLFIDQFEELYTLCGDSDERAIFLACLAGAADDTGSPVRVVLSMRADFLERLAENRSFMALATRGLMLLPPMGRAGLQAALEKPLEAAGYMFESGDTVRDILDGLDGTRGALPLLQFAATMLWRERDRKRRLLTDDSYRAMGGIAGALAKHADAVVAAMTESRRKLARAVFERLVTPERTRAVVSVEELREMGGVDGPAVAAVLDDLARARLLVVDAGSVEIVHESLIDGWPTLRRWLDEHQEDAAFLARLRTAAREWEKSGRSEGMLWRDEMASEARHWHRNYQGELPATERHFLDAVLAMAVRTRQRKRNRVMAVIMFLAGALVIAILGLLRIGAAEQKASERADQLQTQSDQLQAQSDQLQAQRDQLAAKQGALTRALTQARSAQRAEAEAKQEESLRAKEAEQARAQVEELLLESQRQRSDALWARAQAEKKAEEAEKARAEADIARQEAERLRREAEVARDAVEREKSKLQKLLEQHGIKKPELKRWRKR